MIAILSLLIIVTLSLLITRIAAMVLMLTGMSSESARFQARSAFTGSGFTTGESEAVVNHPVRRRIIMLLMLLGNIGIATVIATAVLSFINTGKSEQWWWYLLILVGGVIVLVSLSISRRVEYHLNRLIAFCLKKWTKLDVTDYVSVLQLQNGYAVTEMKIDPGDWLDGKTLIEAALPREGVLVLGIERSDGSYIGTPRASDQIYAGNTLILYGLSRRIAELDQRRAGSSGEQAHNEAVIEHQQERLYF
jgi:MFS family permease